MSDSSLLQVAGERDWAAIDGLFLSPFWKIVVTDLFFKCRVL